MAHGVNHKMGTKWPDNGEKIAKWPQIPMLNILGYFFSRFEPWVIFYFSANLFPFSAFSPFSILCQAAWLAMLGDSDTLGPAKTCTLRGTLQTYATEPEDCDRQFDN